MWLAAQVRFRDCYDPAVDDGRASSRSDLGRRLRQRRCELGLTVEQVALAAGINAGYLRYLEEKPGWPLMNTLVRLASVLRISVPALLGVGDTATRT